MKKNYKLVIMLLSVMILVMLSACGTSEKEDEAISEETDDGVEIVMPHDNYYYTGNERTVGMIVEELEELGFTNITTIEDEPGWYYFSVESVEIFTDSSDKDGTFDEGDVFSSNDLVEIHYYGGPLEDGMIQDTNIFAIEEQLKNMDGYTWSEDHGVIEGKTGYFGTCLCEENDIWVDLYGNDLEMIESASIDVYEADYEVLITFVSYFDTELISAEEVQQWMRECDPKNEECTKIFGDAEFSLFYGMENDEKYSLYITALE